MPAIEKELMYSEIKKRVDGNAIFFSSFGKLKVDDFQSLRSQVRKKSGKCLVVKKTLAKRLLNEKKVTVSSSLLEGPVMIATAPSEPQDLSKTLVDFAKGNDEFSVRGVFIDGELKDQQFVEALSKLPSREQLLATLLSTMKAPVNNFVYAMSGIMKNFVVVVNEVKKQKENS